MKSKIPQRPEMTAEESAEFNAKLRELVNESAEIERKIRPVERKYRDLSARLRRKYDEIYEFAVVVGEKMPLPSGYFALDDLVCQLHDRYRPDLPRKFSAQLFLEQAISRAGGVKDDSP